MRVRLRTPNGTHTLTFQEDAALSDLNQEIESKTGFIKFDIKAGYPPQPLEFQDIPLTTLLRNLPYNLNGEQLIISKNNDPDLNIPEPSAPLSLRTPNRPSPSNDRDPPEITLPSHDGTLVLRVMPDDNSCLFRALSHCLFSPSSSSTAISSSSSSDDTSATSLRQLVARTIQADTSGLYGAAVLGRPRAAYCEWIVHPDAWGGYIETGIVAAAAGVEIVALDVETGRAQVYPADGAVRRCFIVYSGIHYDAIALVRQRAGTGQAAAAGEDGRAQTEQTQFEIWDEDVRAAADRLVNKLRGKGYYTNTSTFAIKCGTCGWIGNGEKEARDHGNRTGHSDFEQV